MEKRTFEDFVEDLVSDGRRCEYIIAVAYCTKWRDQIQEIEAYSKKLLKNFKKNA